MLAKFLQVCVNAISLSLIYVLFSSGLTLIMGIFDVGNFAHGEFVMVASFAAYLIITKWGLPYFLAPIVAIVLVSLIGVVMERGIFYPMRFRTGLEPALATFGASFALQTGALLIFGGMPKGVAPIISGQVEIGSVFFSLDRIPIIFGGVIAMSLLFWFVQRTKLGLGIRAAQQDQDAAALQGINISNIRIMVWIVASSLAAVAGILLSPITYIQPFMGTGLFLKGIAVVIVGGMGSIPGALLGGFILGFVDAFGQTYLGTASYSFAFALIMLILIIRPQGLLGKR